MENELISSNQFGFSPDDNCINQLLSIAHKKYECFDVRLEVRSVFLNISKTFDKVWYNGMILKITHNRILENYLNFLPDFLRKNKHLVILNGQVSTQININAALRQCSILGSLLFLIYINDFTEGSIPLESYLQIIALSFLLHMTLKLLKMISIKMRKHYGTGIFNGKRTLIQILPNKFQKCLFVAKQNSIVSSVSV